MSAVKNPRFILNLRCPDQRGVVAAVSQFLFERGANVIDSQQFGDATKQEFFLRIYFASEQGRSLEQFREGFAPIVEKFAMDARFYDAQAKTRTLIMVSKFGHCLVDLLYRDRIGALPIQVVGVVSNHRDFADVAAAHGLPFHYLPVTRENKMDQEAALLRLVEEKNIDLVVLARYMQVLSEQTCAALSGRCINIHHSFLPSFKGAGPYSQAHARGVKIIGATAHYVTSDLDEGPIIEQGVERVTHALTPSDFAAIGRDIEAAVLARAVKWHCEHRILLDGRRTVVFS
jgi:formyltetrahydrofolate deformylase